MTSARSIIVFCLALIGTLLLSFAIQKPFPIHAETTHVVISQIQLGGTGKANQEFVELYNPTSDSVDLAGWRLSKRTASLSGTLTSLVSSMSGQILPHRYFLVAHPIYTNATVSADFLYGITGSGIAADNSVILFSDNGHTVVDKLGFGNAQDVEGTAAPALPNDESLMRKATTTSTVNSLAQGGSEEFLGNGFDSDNNAGDFLLQTIPNPRNASFRESPPIITPEVTPIEEPTITETPTPSPTDGSTPTPTATPSPPPAGGSTPTPTNTPLPEITPTPMKEHDKDDDRDDHKWKDVRIAVSRRYVLVCTVEYKTMHYGKKRIRIPQYVCRMVREEKKGHDHFE